MRERREGGKVMDVMSGKELKVEQKWNGMRVESQSRGARPSTRFDQRHAFHFGKSSKLFVVSE